MIRDLTPSGSLRLWTALYALSGFLALSLEVVWFRLMDVGVKSTAFTFGTVLCLYLLGLGAGSLAGGFRAKHLARPLDAFLDYQLLLLALAGAAVALVAWLPPSLPVSRWFVDYWGHDPFFQLGADWNAGALARLYVLLPLALFGAPTVLMGLSFGALQRAVQDDPATSGRKVGLLQAANIAGCTAGSLTTGLVLLERIGTAPTLRLLVGVGGLVFLCVRARSAGLSRGLAARAAAIVLVLVSLPSNDRLWKRLHGVAADEPPSFIGEDASALSVVVPGAGRRWRVAVNGLPHSWLPYEGRLKPGGLVCTQKPSRRVGLLRRGGALRARLRQHRRGEQRPHPDRHRGWQARLRRPGVARRFGAATIPGILDRLLDAVPARRNPAARVGLNHDLFPRDEFATPAGW